MREKFESVTIKSVAFDEEHNSPFLILENILHKKLRLDVGPFEASAIITEMEGIKVPRPMTHDVLADFFHKHGFACVNLQIYQFCHDKFYSRINYRRGLKSFVMELRPSDGIALALRLKKPVYVSEQVFSQLAEQQVFWDTNNYEQYSMLTFSDDSRECSLP